jgi:chemotaxis protein MotB
MSRPSKRRRRLSDSGLDDWLMTYADMITLLLCFFAVFLSVSVPKKEMFLAAQQKVLEQFSTLKDQDIIVLPTPIHSESGGLYNALPSFVDQNHSGEGNLAAQGMMGADGTRKGQSNKKADFKEPKGDRIIRMEIPSAAFFAIGAATLSPEGRALLHDLLSKQLRPEVIADYQVTIEGHTDDSPINTAQFPSNWELSTGRAASVVRFLIENGVPAQKLRAAGYADVFPKMPNRDSAGKPIPENQTQNRRVVIKLEKIEKFDPENINTDQ